jgi:hypothetical protein
VAQNFYHGLAVATVAAHLVFIGWVIFGCLLTHNRRLLTWFHILSLVYGVAIEAGPWPCPLTILEQWFQRQAGITPYTESFLIHYLEEVVYPDVPQDVLVWGAALVCLFNLGVYGVRFWRKQSGRPG